jgi:hypothetical protein
MNPTTQKPSALERDQAAFLSELPAGARILIVRLRSLGNAVLATPALRALKRRRPDLRLSILLYPRFAPVLRAGVKRVLAPAGVVRMA